MEASEIAKLKKKYPEEYYIVEEKQGKLTVKEQTARIWVPLRFTKPLNFNSAYELNEFIEKMLAIELPKGYFNCEQKTVSKKVFDKLVNVADFHHVPKLTFLVALLERRA